VNTGDIEKQCLGSSL